MTYHNYIRLLIDYQLLSAFALAPAGSGRKTQPHFLPSPACDICHQHVKERRDSSLKPWAESLIEYLQNKPWEIISTKLIPEPHVEIIHEMRKR